MIYNFAGPEDLLTGQASLTKCNRDRKPSNQVIQQNEAKVPVFHRTCWCLSSARNRKQRGGTLESEDMYYIMNGDAWKEPSKALESFSPSPAKESFTPGTKPGTPNSMAETEKDRTQRLQHDFQMSTLRPWAADWSATNIPRTSNSLVDWGGLNGLGIWSNAAKWTPGGIGGWNLSQPASAMAKGMFTSPDDFVDYTSPASRVEYTEYSPAPTVDQGMSYAVSAPGDFAEGGYSISL